MAAGNIYTLAIEGELNARAQEIKHRMHYDRLRKVGQLEHELEAAKSGAQENKQRMHYVGPRKVERLQRKLEDAKSRAGVTLERVKAA